ncbi:MAG: DUF2845 domain-containing protein [Gammaproteobacteria bacterium]|jgi:hypothetical protein
MNILQWACAAVLFIVWSTVLSPALADADGMRCGNKLVVSGDTKLEVLKKCGEPDFSETVKMLKTSKTVNLADRTSTNLTSRHSSLSSHHHSGQSGITLGTETIEAIEQWSYNRGPTQFIKVLTFRAGRLESVEETERGFSD